MNISYEPAIPSSYIRSTTMKRCGQARMDLDTPYPCSKVPAITPPDTPSSTQAPCTSSPFRPVSAAKRRRLFSSQLAEMLQPVSSSTTPRPSIAATSSPASRMRTSFTFSQLQTLEETYSAHDQINRSDANKIAREFGLPVECIASWFSNRRDLQRKRDQRRLVLLREKQKSVNCSVLGIKLE